MTVANTGAAVSALYASELATARTMIESGKSAALHAAVYSGILMYNGVFGATKTPVAVVRALISGNLKRSKNANDDFVERTLSTAIAFARYLEKNPNAAIVQANSIETGYDAALAFLASNGVSDRKALIDFLKNARPKAVGAKDTPAKTFAERIGASVAKQTANAEMGALMTEMLAAQVMAGLTLEDAKTFAAATHAKLTALLAAEGEALAEQVAA